MVYIHVPFCRSFCTYCDFYSEIACRGKDAEAIKDYTLGVLSEIAARRDEIRATEGIRTLYIGGGTPSVLPLSVIESFVRALEDNNCLKHTSFEEFTIEVNPEDVVEKGQAYISGLLELGVNRISMGVQSLDDGIIKWMNRRHDAATARKAFRILRQAGVNNISIDIIFGISQLGFEQLSASISEVIAWHPEHISAYQLSIEDGSALAQMLRDGRYEAAPDEQCAAQYELICTLLHDAGYLHYEISNWALPRFEAKHNSAYWKRQPYVGLGPSAHSFNGRERTWNSQNLSGWISSGEILNEAQAREEEIMLGLRTAAGIPLSICSKEVIQRLIDSSSLEFLADSRVRIPESRFFVCDDIILSLIS